ncbi:MAG: hypothetical protein KAJ24_03855 [Candidatus Aenigmarchaeota archaeon]|nr:hypothetical protein [Candidatus Aenigmarchaeota archaeon]
MAKGNIVWIPDIGDFCSSNLNLIKDVSKEAKQVLPIFSGYNSPKDFLEEVLGYSVDAHTEAAYLVPLNHARLDAVGKMLYDDNVSLLGPNATEKQINEVVALLKTEKADLEHYIKAELDDFADGSIQYSKDDLKSALRAATAQQIREVVPPHLREKYRDELDTFAAYLDGGASPLSESGHVSLIKNEAGQSNTHDVVYKGIPVAVAAGALSIVLYEIFGAGASGLSKDVVPDSEVQHDTPAVAANDTPNQQDADEEFNNRPDWLIQKKNLLGNEYFEIDRNLLPIEGSELKLVEGNNDKFDDDVMKPNDGVPEMMAGIDAIIMVDLEGNENKYEIGVLIVDNDFLNKYDGVLAQGPAYGKSGQLRFDKENAFTEISNDVFVAMVPVHPSEKSRFCGDLNSGNPVIAYEKI